MKVKIPEKVDFRGKKYSKHSIHNKKNIAKREANKIRIEGHLATVKSFPQRHVVYIKKKKLIPLPKLERETYRIVDGKRYDMVTWNWKKKDSKKYAERQKGLMFENYRIFREKKKWGKNKGKSRYVIYGSNFSLIDTK